MDTFAEYILNETDFSKKAEIAYYLHKKTGIYFDNSATTKMDDKVFDYMRDFNERYYANPSALHRFGFLVEKEIKNAALDISNILHVDPSEIIWTSGGTESNNLALYGTCYFINNTSHHLVHTFYVLIREFQGHYTDQLNVLK